MKHGFKSAVRLSSGSRTAARAGARRTPEHPRRWCRAERDEQARAHICIAWPRAHGLCDCRCVPRFDREIAAVEAKDGAFVSFQTAQSPFKKPERQHYMTSIDGQTVIHLLLPP